MFRAMSTRLDAMEVGHRRGAITDMSDDEQQAGGAQEEVKDVEIPEESLIRGRNANIQ